MLTQLLILSSIEVNVNKGGRLNCRNSVRQSRDHWVPNYLTFILIRLGKQVRINDKKQDITVGVIYHTTTLVP